MIKEKKARSKVCTVQISGIKPHEVEELSSTIIPSGYLYVYRKRGLWQSKPPGFSKHMGVYRTPYEAVCSVIRHFRKMYGDNWIYKYRNRYKPKVEVRQYYSNFRFQYYPVIWDNGMPKFVFNSGRVGWDTKEKAVQVANSHC